MTTGKRNWLPSWITLRCLLSHPLTHNHTPPPPHTHAHVVCYLLCPTHARAFVCNTYFWPAHGWVDINYGLLWGRAEQLVEEADGEKGTSSSWEDVADEVPFCRSRMRTTAFVHRLSFRAQLSSCPLPQEPTHLDVMLGVPHEGMLSCNMPRVSYFLACAPVASACIKLLEEA